MTADGHNVPWLFLPDPNLNCDQIVAILPNTQSNGMHSILKGSQCTNFRVPNISSWLKSREPFAANKSGISCDMPSTFNAFRRCHCFCRHHCYLHWCCLMHSSLFLREYWRCIWFCRIPVIIKLWRNLPYVSSDQNSSFLSREKNVYFKPQLSVFSFSRLLPSWPKYSCWTQFLFTPSRLTVLIPRLISFSVSWQLKLEEGKWRHQTLVAAFMQTVVSFTLHWSPPTILPYSSCRDKL